MREICALPPSPIHLLSTRKPTVGGGAGFSGACALPSAWRVLRPLLCALRFSAKPTRGPEPGTHALEQHNLTPDLLATTGCRSLFSVVFLCPSVCVCPEVTVTSLHPPRLCRPEWAKHYEPHNKLHIIQIKIILFIFYNYFKFEVNRFRIFCPLCPFCSTDKYSTVSPKV